MKTTSYAKAQCLTPRMYVTVLCATLLLPAACATGSAGSFCDIYIPVYTADSDTDETRRQADSNNAVWWQQCAINADSAPDGS